jgi:hypothetical protein
MSHYILRYSGGSVAPAEHMQSILGTPGVRVIDRSANMLLVDADEATLRMKIAGMPGWSLHPEQQIPLPDTRRRID